MGKVKKKNPASQVKKEAWFGSGVEIDYTIDSSKYVFSSDKLEEVNKLVRNLKLPEFDSDGNPIL